MILISLFALIIGILLLSKVKNNQELTAPKSYLTKLRVRPRSTNY
jgi:hypothetical protein